jgi:hypothetical protein
MADYRVYVIGSDGRFYRSVLLDCIDDAEAMEQARKQLDGHDIELWQLDRKVALIDHQGQKSTNAWIKKPRD